MKIFVLKSCDTCRRALRELARAGYEPEVCDVRSDGVSRQELARFLAEFGDEIVNRRSTTWRSLDDAQKGSDPIELLQRHPTLMKRPVVELDGRLFLGWGPQTRVALLG